MALQFSTSVRDARANSTESTIGTSPILEIRTGAPPATPATADSGTLLASMTLPSDWLTNSSSGVKSLSGTWSDPAANNTGTAGHFRIKDSGGSTCHIQGTVTITGGGGDLTLDNTSIATSQVITITSFTMTEANA